MFRCLAFVVATTLAFSATSARAANPIQIENAKPGTLDWLLYQDATAGEIEGYASKTSVNHGESIGIHVSTIAPNYELNIYRVGWYGGLGGRHVHGPVTRTGIHQVKPAPDSLGMIECNWIDPYVLTIPADWVSGVYLVKLSIAEPRRDIYTIFVVREDARRSNHYFQLSVTTYQAYNSWGGKSLYSRYSDNGEEAKKVSFNRPYLDGSGTGAFLWRWEYNFVRFLEREGYDVSYATNVDTHRRGSLLQNHESFLSVGHDEYWSWEMRQAVEAARDAGVDLGFFSANTCYWQIRFEPSLVTGEQDRTIVSYKEDAVTMDPLAIDGMPGNDHLITRQWRQNGRPEAALIGVQYIYDPLDADIVIDDVTSAPWVFEDTGLVKGSRLPGLLGYEVDAMHPNTPAGTIRLGNSPFFNTKTNRNDVSHMTLYTAQSGAYVFATGSIQWAWGLDDWNNNSRGTSTVNPAAQQMTRNLLRKFAGGNASSDCQWTLSPTASTVSAAAGSGTISVSTTKHCGWTATTNADWLTIASTSNSVSYSYAANSGTDRVATITIADKTFTLTQRACAFTLQPSSVVATSAGGTIDVAVTTDNGCAWTAVSNAPWITVTGGASGSGNGTVSLSIASTTGPARTGTVTIGGVVLTISQQNGCAYSFSPDINTMSLPANETNATVTITTSSPECPWTASTPTPWLTILGPTSGNGNGTVTIHAEANPGVSRDGELRLNGIYYNVYQASGCRYTVTPTNVAFPVSGGEGVATIETDATCHWRASSPVSWIVITSGANGNGNGQATYTVQANSTGSTRVANLTVAGQTVTVTQTADNCTYSLTPDVMNYGSMAASGSFDVLPSGNCTWAAEIMNGGSWLTITGGASGTGPGTVTFTIKQNPNASARVANVRVGSQTFSLSQSGSGYVPMVLSATANGTSVVLSWNAVSGATGYELQRGTSIDALLPIATLGSTSYTDTAVVASKTYVYRVRAMSGGNALTYSNVEIATTIAFTDAALIRGVTPMRAVHIEQLRVAVNAMRAAANLPYASFAEAIAPGVVIRASHIQELRNALAPARAVLGLAPMSFGPLTIIRAIDVESLREGVR